MELFEILMLNEYEEKEKQKKIKESEEETDDLEFENAYFEDKDDYFDCDSEDI